MCGLVNSPVFGVEDPEHTLAPPVGWHNGVVPPTADAANTSKLEELI